MVNKEAAHKAARLAVIFEKAMRQQGTNPYRLAKQTGLGLLTVQRMTAGESHHPGLWATLTLAKALGLDPAALFAEVEKQADAGAKAKRVARPRVRKKAEETGVGV